MGKGIINHKGLCKNIIENRWSDCWKQQNKSNADEKIKEQKTGAALCDKVFYLLVCSNSISGSL